MNRRKINWEAIAAAYTAPAPSDEGAPYGLATRVVAAWRVARRDDQISRWSRWSLRAALGSVAVCALVLAWSAREDDPILLTPPHHPLSTPMLPAP